MINIFKCQCVIKTIWKSFNGIQNATYWRFSNCPIISITSANSEVQVTIFSLGWQNSFLISLLASSSAFLPSILQSELSLQNENVTMLVLSKTLCGFQLLWGTETKILNIIYSTSFYLPFLISNTPYTACLIRMLSSNAWKIMFLPIPESAYLVPFAWHTVPRLPPSHLYIINNSWFFRSH